MRNIFFIVSFTLLIANCKDQNPAPIEYNHNKDFSRNTGEETKYPERTVSSLENTNESIEEKPLSINKEELENPMGVLKAPESEEDILPPNKTNVKTIYYEVQEGDTLDKIARRYEQTPEKIAKLNNLNKPYHLEEFQIVLIEVSQELLNKINMQGEEEKDIPEQPAGNQIFINPVDNGEIIKKFGQQTDGKKNYGIDISAKVGSKIKSVADGTVVYADFDKKFGNLIIVKLDYDDMYAAYAHMEDLILEKNAIVKQGQVLGHVGSTGDASSPQLHFALRKGKTSVDPMGYLQF